MNNETLLIIQKSLEELLNKQDSTVTASFITVFGMLSVALISGIIQYKVTKTIIRSEDDKMKLQLNAESKFRQYESWKIRFQEVSSELLKELDPELNKHIDNEEKLVALIHKTQIMLNLEIESHCNVNNLINKLGLEINGKTNYHELTDLLILHGLLVDAIRNIISIKKEDCSI